MNLSKIILKLFSVPRSLFILITITSVLSAGGGLGQNFRNAFGGLCYASLSLLGVGAILLIVLAAIVYAIGQMLGAETRARATVWATAMFTGAIIGAIIFLVVPYLISTIMTGTPNGDWVRNCCVENPTADCANLQAP